MDVEQVANDDEVLRVIEVQLHSGVLCVSQHTEVLRSSFHRLCYAGGEVRCSANGVEIVDCIFHIKIRLMDRPGAYLLIYDKAGCLP